MSGKLQGSVSSEKKRATDRFIYHASTLKLAEAIRNKLMRYKPRPCVYVYILSETQDDGLGYDIAVATEWGTHPSEEFFLELQQYLNVEAPIIEARIESENN